MPQLILLAQDKKNNMFYLRCYNYIIMTDCGTYVKELIKNNTLTSICVSFIISRNSVNLLLKGKNERNHRKIHIFEPISSNLEKCNC